MAVAVRGLQHWYGEGAARKICLVDNNLALEPGELVVLTGPSGSGKTTLLTLIGALRTVQKGSVKVLGRELAGLSAGELTSVRAGIGFVFQAHNLFDSLSAFENVRMALELGEADDAEMDRRAREILERLGLADRVDYLPEHLSGGQRQRVAVARALANRPKLILADEPTAALDKESGREVVDLFRERTRDDGATVLLVTHDRRVLDRADRIVHLVDGTIAEDHRRAVRHTRGPRRSPVDCPA